MVVIFTFNFTPLVLHDPVLYIHVKLSVDMLGGHRPAAIVLVPSIYNLQTMVFV